MPGQPYIVVYADLAFCSNLIMDALVIWLAGRLIGRPAPRLRLWIAALLGAVYALACALWPYSILGNGLLKLAVALLMVGVAYRPVGWRWFWRHCAAFFLASFALGGGVYGLWQLCTAMGLRHRTAAALAQVYVTPALVFLPLGVAIAAGLLLSAAGQRRRQAAAAALPAVTEITVAWQKGAEKGQMNLQALPDTGHRLQEPLSGLPVVVIALAALDSAFAAAISQQGWETLDRLPCATVTGVKYLPLWGPCGLWVAGRPAGRCWLGLSPKGFPQDGGFQALLPADLVAEMMPEDMAGGAADAGLVG